MNAKTILFFSDGTNGWEEVYYQTCSDLNGAFANAVPLMNARSKLLAQPAQCIYIRVNDDANPRASTLTPVTPILAWPYNSESDVVDTAAMMRLYAGSVTRSRPLYLRGNPDSAYDLATPTNQDAQNWLNNFYALGSLLSGSASVWQLKYRPHPIFTGAGANVFNIVSVTPSTNGSKFTTITFTGTLPTPLVPNNYVQIYKVTGLPTPMGLCRVASVASGVQFDVYYRCPSDYNYSRGGVFLPYSPSYAVLDSYAGNPRWTRRATGRPFDVTRGRRRSISR